VDEVLTVGDEAFQRKCQARMRAFRDHGATVLMVSRNTAMVQALCQRAVWLDHSTIRALGRVDEVAAQYHNHSTVNHEISPSPDGNVTRAEMAVFLLRAKYGETYNPPVTTGIFADVPSDLPSEIQWMSPWIEQLYREGITTGCAANPLQYCPQRNVTRAEMAVFLLRAKHGSGYTPRAATGVFADVPWGMPSDAQLMAPWIEQFYREGITTGCAANPLQYCPQRNVTRAEMVVFLARTFLGLRAPISALPALQPIKKP
jgi:hypothetical protein